VTLGRWLGAIDIYLLDQILRGRIQPGMRVLDAGCGSGRNLVFLLRMGCHVHGFDRSHEALARARAIAVDIQPEAPGERFRQGDLAQLPYEDAAFDLVVSSAVLHFAEGPEQFETLLGELWRVLVPGGILFARLASSIGIEERIEPVGEGRFRIPDGSTRYLVDEERLLSLTDRLGGELLDPIKTTNVQGLRCMTTWCLRKNRVS
jgi:SAM-dependent methyltransferase